MRYSISKVEKITGVSQSTIRRYENAGLICPNRDSNSNYRYFSTGDIARLSVYIATRQQHYFPHEQRRLSAKKDRLPQVHQRLKEIENEIERLNAEKVCWERHIELFALMEKLKNQPDSGQICWYETLVGSWFEDEQSIYEALFFRMLRERSIYCNYFRLCCLYPQNTETTLPYRQAYLAPLDLLNKVDLLKLKNSVLMPEQAYITAYAPGKSIIDEENSEQTQIVVEHVHVQIDRLLNRFSCKQDGDAMVMTVCLTPESHEAILFIPINLSESDCNQNLI